MVVNKIIKYKINKGLITQKIDNKTVIFDSEESLLYTLNETAAIIFLKLKKGLSESEIIQIMVKKYQIKEEKVKKDLIEFLSDLKKKKIIFSSNSKK